jgi:hypothetical protein
MVDKRTIKKLWITGIAAALGLGFVVGFIGMWLASVMA